VEAASILLKPEGIAMTADLKFHPLAGIFPLMEGAQRYWRHWVSYDVLRALPFLPKRVAKLPSGSGSGVTLRRFALVFELKEFGFVHLRHTKRPGVVPALNAGFYKMIASDGRLYVVEMGRRRPNGEPASACLYRPLVRVKAVAA
jgi:hypothetical protein